MGAASQAGIPNHSAQAHRTVSVSKNNGQRQSMSLTDRLAVSPNKSNSSSASHILRIHPASGLIFRFFS